MIAERTAIPMAVVSVVAVLLVCIVLGKVFCAWACPVHFMSRGRKKGDKGAGSMSHSPSCHPERAEHSTVRWTVELPSTRSERREAPRSGDEGSRAATAARLSADAALDPSTTAPCASAQDDKRSSPCSTCASPCGKSKGIKIDSRHGILAAALGSTLVFGFPVFCLVCPIGLTFATVLLVMRLFAFGDATWTVVAFPVIIALEILLLPKWCQRFCPLGALLSLFSGLNRTFRPQVDAEKCLREGRGKACNLCEQACPEGINLHDVAAGETTLNDCSKCRACADVCPEHAITFPLLPKKQPAVAALPADDEIPERG